MGKKEQIKTRNLLLIVYVALESVGMRAMPPPVQLVLPPTVRTISSRAKWLSSVYVAVFCGDQSQAAFPAGRTKKADGVARSIGPFRFTSLCLGTKLLGNTSSVCVCVFGT